MPNPFLPLLFLTLLVSSLEAGVKPIDTQAIDAAVKKALQSWQVPGLAVAIVQDDKIIYLQGHGVKTLGQPDPVTPDTLFPHWFLH